MRSFACPTCGQLVFFENTACLRCGSELGFDWQRRELSRRSTAPRALREPSSSPACNWLVARDGRAVRELPAHPHAPGRRRRRGRSSSFRVAEAAKRRLLFELGELGLPVQSWREREGGLAFELLSSEREPVTTGHADGVITLDLAESDDAHREALREQLGEPYRTVLGHFRHEVGHYYWPLLVARGERSRERCRALFGDEREDYRRGARAPLRDRAARRLAAALRQRLRDDAPVRRTGPRPSPTTCTSATRCRPRAPTACAWAPSAPGARRGGLPRRCSDDWLPLTYALNALNRSMGRDDLYPFVLPAPVVDKLAFVHERVTAARHPG